MRLRKLSSNWKTDKVFPYLLLIIFSRIFFLMLAFYQYVWFYLRNVLTYARFISNWANTMLYHTELTESLIKLICMKDITFQSRVIPRVVYISENLKCTYVDINKNAKSWIRYIPYSYYSILMNLEILIEKILDYMIHKFKSMHIQNWIEWFQTFANWWCDL